MPTIMLIDENVTYALVRSDVDYNAENLSLYENKKSLVIGDPSLP